MNIGFWMCIVLIPIWMLMAAVFGILKEKSAMLISGFNTLPAAERKLYDRAAMARDMRNSCCIWTIVMAAGAFGSYFFTPYAAGAAYIIWLVLFFKNVKLDAHKAFEKYLYEETVTK